MKLEASRNVSLKVLGLIFPENTYLDTSTLLHSDQIKYDRDFHMCNVYSDSDNIIF